jgi:hypothetical protein
MCRKITENLNEWTEWKGRGFTWITSKSLWKNHSVIGVPGEETNRISDRRIVKMNQILFFIFHLWLSNALQNRDWTVDAWRGWVFLLHIEEVIEKDVNLLITAANLFQNSHRDGMNLIAPSKNGHVVGSPSEAVETEMVRDREEIIQTILKHPSKMCERRDFCITPEWIRISPDWTWTVLAFSENIWIEEKLIVLK